MTTSVRGLQSIFEKHPSDVEVSTFSFLNEETLEGNTILLPATSSLNDLKDQVRKDFNYPLDSKCIQGHHLKLIYPKDGIELSAAQFVEEIHHSENHPHHKRSKKIKHKNCVELSDDSRWSNMKKHWNKGTAHRRDISLVKYTSEVANIIGSNAPASSTFIAAKRLCCIIGVPHNVNSIKRLKRNYIIFNAIHDLISYRDPHVTSIVDNCEALSIACGCHLHWYLSQSMDKTYRHHRTDGGYMIEGDDASKKDKDEDDGIGVPPEYEKYVRLTQLGQSVKATIKQMLDEGLDPSIIGLIDNTQEDQMLKKKRSKRDSVRDSVNSIASGSGADNEDNDDDEDKLEVSYDAPTTEALLMALKHATGAIRFRQRKILSEAMTPPAPPRSPEGKEGEGDAKFEKEMNGKEKVKLAVSIQIDDESSSSSSESKNSKSVFVEDNDEKIEDDEGNNDNEKDYLKEEGQHAPKLTIVVDDDGDVELQHNNSLYITEEELKTRKMLNNRNENDSGYIKSNNDILNSYPHIEFMDNIMHADWEQCSDECLDVTAYMCLGALWCNLEKNEDAVWCHGEEALSYSLLLSIHGGCTNFAYHHGSAFASNGNEPLSGGGTAKTPKTPFSPSNAPLSPNGLPNMKQVNDTFSNSTNTGFVDEDNYIFQMQSVATHFACFLLTVEPGLKSYLAAQSACPLALPALTSTLNAINFKSMEENGEDGGVGMDNNLMSPLISKNEGKFGVNDLNNDQDPTNGVQSRNHAITVKNEIHKAIIDNIGISLVLPGLAELTFSKDSKIAMCGATMIAGVVANPDTRKLISGSSAQLALPAILSYALKLLFKRNQYRKSKLDEFLQKTDKDHDDEDTKASSVISQQRNSKKINSQKESLNDINVEGFSPDLLTALRGPQGNNAASKFDHALVAVWGLLHILFLRKGVVATANANHAYALANAAIGGSSDKKPPNEIYKSLSRKHRHHRHRRLQKQIKTSQSYGVDSANSVSGTSSSLYDQIKKTEKVEHISPKDTILYEMANLPNLKVCHAATAIPISSPQLESTSPRSPITAMSPNNASSGGVMNASSVLMTEPNDLLESNRFIREETVLDEFGEEVGDSLVERVVMLCSCWNKPHALRELTGYENPNTNIEEVTAQVAASFREEETAEEFEEETTLGTGTVGSGIEEGENEDVDDVENNSSVKDETEVEEIKVSEKSLTDTLNEDDSNHGVHEHHDSAAHALFSELKIKETTEEEKEEEKEAASAENTATPSDTSEKSTVAFNAPSFLRKSIPHHKPLFQYQALPKGSGGCGYGPLSEVEIRCSLGCLALIAQVECVKTTALLGSVGLARILLFAEMNPEQGASEEVQEVALSALSHLCSAADAKHLKYQDIAPTPGVNHAKYHRSSHHNGFGHSPHHGHHNHGKHSHHNLLRHKSSSVAGSSKQVVALTGNEDLFKAWEALRILVKEHHAIERLSALRQTVTMKARQGATSRGTSRSSIGDNPIASATMNRKISSDPIERERTKQRRWDMVKSVALAIMHLSGLEQSESIKSKFSPSSSVRVTEGGKNDVSDENSSAAAVSTADVGAASSISIAVENLSKEDGETLSSPPLSPEESKARNSSALATVMVAAQARSLFARKRLECVAQQLWSDNKTVVTEACASVWLLGRSLAVRAALSRLCVDGQSKVTGLITGRHFPMVRRLIECASGNSDDSLRSWALAALSTLCCDPNFQKKHAHEVMPCLVENLVTYADEGDPKEKKKIERRERKDRELFYKQKSSFTRGILPKDINYVVGGARQASLLLHQTASLSKQRLAACSVSSLLLLAYFHQPSLQALKNVHLEFNRMENIQNPIENEMLGFGGIEYALYRMCKRKDICRRVKRCAGHLLFLLCSQDMDKYLSHCRDPHSKEANQTIFEPPNNLEQNVNTKDDGSNNDVFYRKDLVPPSDAGPLWRLNASVKKQHSSLNNMEQGVVLEELYLHMLNEEISTDYDTGIRGSEGDEYNNIGNSSEVSPGLFDAFNHNYSNGIGSSPSLYTDGTGLDRNKKLKDPTLPQAREFGFLDGGDGDEYEVEKDTLIRLCLHCLTDLAARRDKAKFFIINQGGANLASKLIRQQRLENKMKYEDDEFNEEDYDVEGEVEGDDSDSDEELQEGDGNTAKEEWRIIMPLHLILNCSTCEKAQPRLCHVMLDDLIRATMTLTGTHGSAALEVQLAYSALANISRNAKCRSLIYKHSLAAGILPPGARDWTKGKTFTKQKKGYEDESSNLSWDYPGKHPLYQVVKQQNSEKNLLVSAPKKDKSCEASFGRTTRPTTSSSSQHQVAASSSTLRPVTAPSSVSSNLFSSVAKQSLDQKEQVSSLVEKGSLSAHTSNHPVCIKNNDPSAYKDLHPSIGLYHLASTSGQSPKPISQGQSIISPIKVPSKSKSSILTNLDSLDHKVEISNTLQNGDLLSSLGFSTGHFGGSVNIGSKNNVHGSMSMLGTCGVIDVDDELTISGNDDDEQDEFLKSKHVQAQQAGDGLGSHVASVQSWMFKSNSTKPPQGAPHPHHITTNAPILLPDPAFDVALHNAANHPAAPLIAQSSSSSFWGGEVFNPPGATTTRGRTSDGVSSKMAHNVKYPYGVDGWHPDIVHCAAERKEWLQMEEGGGLSKMDTLAGSALASTFKKKKSNERAAKFKKRPVGLKQITLTATTSAKLQKSIVKKRNNSLNDDDDDDDKDKDRSGVYASKIAKHKLKVLKKVINTTMGNSLDKVKKSTTVGGNAVGAISLTVNPNICRGNHFNFKQDKGRPEPPPKPSQNLTSTTSNQSQSPHLPALNHLESVETLNNGHKEVNGDMLSANSTLSKGKKKAVKSALNQLNTKKGNNLSMNGKHDSVGGNNHAMNEPPVYPELENVSKRVAMTAGERRAEKLRAASAFACKNATKVSKPRNDVSRVWMWQHVEGSQVSQDAGLIPYQLPVTNPLAKRPSITSEKGLKEVSDGNKKKGDMFHNLMAAAIASSASAAIETGGSRASSPTVGFKNVSKTISTSSTINKFKSSAKKKKFRNSIRISSQIQNRENNIIGSRIITAPFFFHLKSNPASPFPPPPLPPPPAPNLRCDVFQRYLPTKENGTSADGASGGPEHQVCGEWVKLDSGPLKQMCKVPPNMPGKYLTVPDNHNPALTANVTVPMSELSPLGVRSPISPMASPMASPLSPVRGGSGGHIPKATAAGSPPSTKVGKVAMDTSQPAPSLGLQRRVSSKHAGIFQSSKSMDFDNITSTGSGWFDPSKISFARLAWLHAPRTFDDLVPVVVGDHIVVGGMPLKHISLLVRAPKALPVVTPKAVQPLPPKIKGPPWDYNVSSIFVPRRTTTDARSMVDAPHQRAGIGRTPTTNKDLDMSGRVEISAASSSDTSSKTTPIRRGSSASKGRGGSAKKRPGPFEHDWQKCLAKGDRFLNLIKKGIYENDHPDVIATAEVLRKHYDWLMYIFLIHASNDISATDASCMGWMSYGALMLSSGIQDNDSKTCREVDIDTMFKAANFEIKGSDPNDDNPLDALTRQEWLEIIIRCAKAKYGSTPATKNDPVCEHVSKLVLFMKERLEEEAEANEDLAATIDFRHEWRLKYFYVEETDKVYRFYEEKLLTLYKSKIDFKDVGHHHYWTLSMFQSLMDEADFYLDCSSFSREEGNLCFYWSKFIVYDYDKNLDEYCHMDWLSFLESLGHIARIKDLPKVSDLKSNYFLNIIELYDKLELLNSDLDSWMAENTKDNAITTEDPFHVKLDMLLQLMFHVVGKKQAAHKAAKLALQKAAAAATGGATGEAVEENKTPKSTKK